MKEPKLTERRNVSMDVEMAQLVDDVRHMARVKSDSEVIRAAIQIASWSRGVWLATIEANKGGIDPLSEQDIEDLENEFFRVYEEVFGKPLKPDK